MALFSSSGWAGARSGWVVQVVWLLLTAGTLQAELNFQYNVLDPTYYLYERDVGDIDGDGHNDVVGVQEGETTLQVFRAPTWVRSTLFTFTGVNKYPRADDFKLADINGDGKLDMVTRLGPGPANDGPGIAVWLENLGGGNFTQRVIGDSPTYVKDIVVADFDGDGRKDVAMRMDSQTQLWLQETNSTWTEVVLNHPTHEGMEAGDLNGDGRPDIILNGFWFETPNTLAAARVAANYLYRLIDGQWINQGGDWTADSCKVVVGDFDGDGTNDVAFSDSERAGYAVTWYRSTGAHGAGPWVAHPVTVVDYCHNLQAADFNLDGKTDLLVGGMIQSDQRGLRLMLNQGGGTNWTEFPIQSDGSYSAEIGDIDNDGDLDIVGIRNWDQGPSWIYRNNAADGLDFWTYHLVSSNHERTFSLCFPDVNGDGQRYIASGRFVYLNPGSGLTGVWNQVTLPDSGLGGVHAFATLDVDGDNLADLIAQQDNPGANRIDIYWVEAANTAGTAWAAPILIGNIPRSSEPEGVQGYAVAQIVAGGQPEVIVNSPQGLYYFSVPTNNPEAGNWARTFIAPNNSEEGIGVADLDNDGDLDISFTHANPHEVKWARNPGDGSGDWQVFTIGEFPEALWQDRCAAADLNGDGRVDIIVTEENYLQPPTADNMACWWEQPANGATNGNWVRHTITATQYTLNSMDVGDVDQDGDIDLVLAEHRGAERIAVWANDGQGNFTEHPVDEGKESHLGARLVDLDGDGDLDLVSIAYDTPNQLHLWRNDSPGDLALRLTGVMAVDPVTVSVRFSKPVSANSAQTLGHYSISGGVSVSNAVLGLDTRTVTLTTSTMAGGSYTLTVNGVTDLASPPHLIASNSQASFTITLDTTPPTITSVIAVNPTTVQVLFSEPVETGSAQSIGNYSLNNGVTVTWALLGSDTRTVTLITTPMTNGNYTLTVSNVTDQALPANAILPGSAAPFSFNNILPAAGVIFRSATSAVDLDSDSSASLTFAQGALTNGYIMAGVSMYDSALNASVTAAIYGGTPMSLLGTIQDTDAYSEVYLFGLAVGDKPAGNYALSLTASTGINQLVFGVSAFSGVSQTDPTGPFASATGLSTTASVNVSSSTGDMVVDIFGQDVGTSTPGDDQTQNWWEEDSTGRTDGGSTRKPATNGLTTMSYAESVASSWAIGAVSLTSDGQALADTIPPTLLLAAGSNFTTVRVLFSEPVAATTAETPGNYSIDQGVSITSAVLDADTRTVTLTTTPLAGGSYTLTVNNVTDRAITPNPIAPESRIDFALPVSVPVLLSIQDNGEGTVTIMVSATPGAQCALQVSSDPSSPVLWENIATNNVGAAGVWTITDSLIGWSYRYYRVMLLP